VSKTGAGAVEGMQREIMTHGPIEVGFKVFTDFMQVVLCCSINVERRVE
jgi:hypothetical protein